MLAQFVSILACRIIQKIIFAVYWGGEVASGRAACASFQTADVFVVVLKAVNWYGNAVRAQYKKCTTIDE